MRVTDRVLRLLTEADDVVPDSVFAAAGITSCQVARARQKCGVSIERVQGIGYRLGDGTPLTQADRLYTLLSSTPGVVSDQILALFGFRSDHVTRCRVRYNCDIDRVQGVGYRLVRKSR